MAVRKIKKENRITGITVCGFKSIYNKQHIEIRPLTILAGANSSGKSSFMQPLLLLKQTLETPSDPGALLLDGQNVKFTSAEQLLSRFAGKECGRDFSIIINLLKQESLALFFRREEGKGFVVEKMIFTDNKEKTTIHPDMTHEEILKILPLRLKDITKNDKDVRWSVFRERCFLAFYLSTIKEPKREIGFFPFSSISPSSIFIDHIQGLIHLPGLRGNPQRTYQRTATGYYFQGTFEAYVASVISQWQSDNKNKLKDLGKSLENMGLTWKVEAKPIHDTLVELRVGRLIHSAVGGTHDLINIADVGFGVSQSLPVVVALLAAQPGQLVYLEQPEIHLHPNAQRKLACILHDAVKRGVVVVVETHSSLLLREIQTLIAKGILLKDDVSLNWFNREADGSTTVKTADLDENGAYGDWPENFDITEFEAEKAYLDAVESRGAFHE